VSERVAVLAFPGSCDDRDALRAVALVGAEPVRVWHADDDLSGAAAVIVPGGFSYGDYLRPGALAALSPAMAAVREFAAEGGPVLGICNGFQVLCEAHLLPGALTRNSSLEFRCVPTWLRVESVDTVFTSGCELGDVLEVPVSHGEGRFVADEETLSLLEREQRVAFRYVRRDGSPVGDQSPNGSMRDIAGIVNERRNVLGMMPHPERACEPLLGSEDGMRLFASVATSFARNGVVPVGVS
jgi:phosphoribosylformylglycinamidine synthase I